MKYCLFIFNFVKYGYLLKQKTNQHQLSVGRFAISIAKLYNILTIFRDNNAAYMKLNEKLFYFIKKNIKLSEIAKPMQNAAVLPGIWFGEWGYKS